MSCPGCRSISSSDQWLMAFEDHGEVLFHRTISCVIETSFSVHVKLIKSQIMIHCSSFHPINTSGFSFVAQRKRVSFSPDHRCIRDSNIFTGRAHTTGTRRTVSGSIRGFNLNHHLTIHQSDRNRAKLLSFCSFDTPFELVCSWHPFFSEEVSFSAPRFGSVCQI